MPSWITPRVLRLSSVYLALAAVLLLMFAAAAGEYGRFLEGAALAMLVLAAGAGGVGIVLAARFSRARAPAPDPTPYTDPVTGVRTSWPPITRRQPSAERRAGTIADSLVLPPNWSVVPSDPWGPNPGRTELRDAEHRIVGWLRPSDGRWVCVDGETLLADTLGNLPQKGPEEAPQPQEPLVVRVIDGRMVTVRRAGVLTDALPLPAGWHLASVAAHGRTWYELYDDDRKVGRLRDRDGRWVTPDPAESLLSNWLGNLPPKGPGGGKPGHESEDPGATTHATRPDFTQEARNGAIPADSAPTGAAVRGAAYLDLLRNAPPRAARASAVLDERQRMEAAYMADQSDRLLGDATSLTGLQREILQGAASGAEARARKVLDSALIRMADFRPPLLELAAPDEPGTQRAIAVAADVKAEAGACLAIAGRALDELIDENHKLRKVAVQQIGMAVAARRTLNVETVVVKGAEPDNTAAPGFRTSIGPNGETVVHDDEPPLPRVRVYRDRHGELREVPAEGLSAEVDASGNYVPPQRRQLQALGREFVLAQLLELGWLRELPGGYVWDMGLPEDRG